MKHFSVELNLRVELIHNLALLRTNTPASLLSLLTIDPRNFVSLNIKGEEEIGGRPIVDAGGQRLWFYGHVTTESGGPMSLKDGMVYHAQSRQPFNTLGP